jgi:hypothetical protein
MKYVNRPKICLGAGSRLISPTEILQSPEEKLGNPELGRRTFLSHWFLGLHLLMMTGMY